MPASYEYVRYYPDTGRITRWYAGRWRSLEGIEKHQAGRRRRYREDPVQRIAADLSSNHIKRERMVDGSRTA